MKAEEKAEEKEAEVKEDIERVRGLLGRVGTGRN